jgi:hypothetical protein
VSPLHQPDAELILRGIKTVEYRTRPTRIIGERFYLYASKAKAARPIWSDDLRVATPPKWMIELAEEAGMIEQGAMLPTAVIIGSAVIEKVTPPDAADLGGRSIGILPMSTARRSFAKPRLHP